MTAPTKTNGSTSVQVPPMQVASSSSSTTLIEDVAARRMPDKGEGKSLKNRVRCDVPGCEKFLGLLETVKKCRCDGKFCKRHNFYLNHNCTYDYLGKHQERLKTVSEGKMRQHHFNHQVDKGSSAY